MRVFEIGNLQSTNPADWLKQVAYYDTYAPDNSTTFNGAWNVYPYFPSGNIPIADINGGLFVVRLDPKTFLPTYSNLDPLGNLQPQGQNPIGYSTIVPEPGLIAVALPALVGLMRRRA